MTFFDDFISVVTGSFQGLMSYKVFTRGYDMMKKNGNNSFNAQL